jgi:uracil-DNA glycosylase family 4
VWQPNKYVPGEGNPNAKILLLGEAPGEDEDATGRPFVGKAGQLLDTLLQGAGIDRSNVWTTNVYHWRPPSNDIERWKEIEQFVGPKEKQHEITWREITEVDPNVIVALGGVAMEFVTGHKGITKWRGSVLPALDKNHKVVSTFHPSHLLRTYGEVYEYYQRYVVQLDLQKAVRQSLYKEYKPPSRVLQIARSSLDVYNYFRQYSTMPYSSIDIEVFKSNPICIGIAQSKHHAISIPLVQKWNNIQISTIPHSDLANIWKMVAQHLASPRYKKIGQNFKFDQERLEGLGFKVENFYADTMLLSHTIQPEFPKSLAFLCSIYTDEPYYKDEGKQFNPKRDRIDQLLQYNAKDAAVTLEVFEGQLKDLEEAA